jgi:hypothetical protein
LVMPACCDDIARNLRERGANFLFSELFADLPDQSGKIIYPLQEVPLLCLVARL